MQVVILCNNRSKDEWISPTHAADVVCIANREDFLKYPEAAAYIDLQFENKKEQLYLLQQLLPGPVIIHSVVHTLQHMDASFIRINAWPGCATKTIEAACPNEALREKATKIFSALQKNVAWLPDEPGFITARVISMIINEAFFALEDGVSTKSEIDTAMKLGTNYPYGPFEWASLIGLQPIADLLQALRPQQHRYAPCELLLKEAANPPGTVPPSV